jgi:sensor domain CHASE-containing protein
MWADYTMASFKLSFSFLLDGQNQMLFNTQAEDATRSTEQLVADPSLQALLAQARKFTRDGSDRHQAVSGIVRHNGQLYAVSAAVLENHTQTAPPNPDPGAVLVFAKSLDEQILPVTAEIMGLEELRVDASSSEDAVRAFLTTADGQPAGTVIWTTSRTGDKLFQPCCRGFWCWRFSWQPLFDTLTSRL